MIGISGRGGGVRHRPPLHGDGRAADGTAGVGAEPRADARRVEVVAARDELLHLLSFPEPRQAHRALPLRPLLELHVRRRHSRFAVDYMPDLSRGAPAADRAGALNGKDESIDDEGDGDGGYHDKEELEWG